MEGAQQDGAKKVRDLVGAATRGLAFVASACIAAKLTMYGTKLYLEAGLVALCGGFIDSVLYEVIGADRSYVQAAGQLAAYVGGAAVPLLTTLASGMLWITITAVGGLVALGATKYAAEGRARSAIVLVLSGCAAVGAGAVIFAELNKLFE